MTKPSHPSQVPEFDNGMALWQPDDDECARFSKSMHERYGTADRIENKGVSVEEAIDNAVKVSKGPVDLTRGIGQGSEKGQKG